MIMPDTRSSFGKACQAEDMTTIHVNGHSAQVNKAVAYNFTSLAKAFNSQVEPVARIGGYNCRNIAGTNTWSNHAWGLAIDINPSKHPQGQRGTFSNSQVRAIRAILSEHPHIRWGGDYDSTVDEMHFEYMGKSWTGNGNSGSGKYAGLGAVVHQFNVVMDFITNPNNWIRIAEISAGGTLTLLALISMFLRKPLNQILSQLLGKVKPHASG